MLSQLVTSSRGDAHFTKELNKVLTALQNDHHEIIDVKFDRSLSRVSALVLYQES
ncbi:hypothetical protein PT274_03615 [Leuconostocaceae bacterium ESL0958]|nr:hypothetical protein [Leuconostocaceae bacterium ESL0958]